MPPKGYKTVTVNEKLYEVLKNLSSNRSIADTIEYLLTKNMEKH